MSRMKRAKIQLRVMIWHHVSINAGPVAKCQLKWYLIDFLFGDVHQTKFKFHESSRVIILNTGKRYCPNYDSLDRIFHFSVNKILDQKSIW